MTQFEHFSTPRILFGSGQFAKIGELAVTFGKSALMITNAKDLTNQTLSHHLAAARVSHKSLPQKGEPTVADVDAALQIAHDENIDLILGIGGGSAIDAAKAVAGLLANGGSALDYMEVIGKARKITRPALPWIAIPCTAGTGAEVTRNAVIGFPEKNFKASLRSEHLLPRIALIDPELAIHVRPEITARTGMDALCQCIEAYTSLGATPLTDPLALEGILRAGRSLHCAYADGTNLAAREDMALAALFSGIALTSAGLGAVHGFAAPLGASFPIPHGTICAALLPHVMSANIAVLRTLDPNHRVLSRYAVIGRTLLNNQTLPTPTAIEQGIDCVQTLCRQLHIPGLSQFNLTEADIPAIVTRAKSASSMRYNPVTLSESVLVSVLKSAL